MDKEKMTNKKLLESLISQRNELISEKQRVLQDLHSPYVSVASVLIRANGIDYRINVLEEDILKLEREGR